MKTSFSKAANFYFLFFFTIFFTSLAAQDSPTVFEAYEDNSSLAREIAYVHLNKSVFVIGEDLGFTAYVVDKATKRPSELTKNLYITIEDQKQNVVAKKLIELKNGVGSNTFQIDSTYGSGYYNIKAYTNWMRNFDEHNYYVENFRVIDPEKEQYIEQQKIENTIEAQFLPESGHLLHGIENSVGAVLKDNNGFGISNAIGEVVDNNGQVLTTFETNHLGIGKFSLLADADHTYSVNVKYANGDFNFPLGHNVERNGVILSTKTLKNKLFISVITNQQTLDLVQNKRYTLMLHNANAFESLDIYFTDSNVVTKKVDYANMPSGINILTLLNENDRPIAERLTFNYEGVDIVKTQDVSATEVTDSIRISLKYDEINSGTFNNISVSVLPQETKSYNRHNNIVSHLFLQPYVKGAIEQAKYYFTDVNEKKRYELDNLLLAQGWSSYDWNNLFSEKTQPYPFEQGISIKANINIEDYREDVFVLHHFQDSPPIYKKATDTDNKFIFENLFPKGTSKVLLSRLKEDGGMVPAQLYLQPFPNAIPKLQSSFEPLAPKPDYRIKERLKLETPLRQNLDEVQKLDEVVVSTKLDKIRTRTNKLGKHQFGTIKVPSDLDKLTFLFLEDYLRANRVGVSFSPESGNVIFTNGRRGGSINGGGGMLVYFDGVPLTDTGFLYRYPIANIDYVEIDRTGFRGGARGANGILKIYSSFDSMFDSQNKTTTQSYKLPLTFSTQKRFYVPKYQSYNDDFYKRYGVVDWKPELEIDEKGIVSFKIAKPQVPITLFIEGMANDGAFIVEEKSISLN